MEIVVFGSLATITAPMQNLASGADRAMREGLYEGGDKVRTRVRRALKVQTNVKAYGSITQRVPSVRAGLTYIIRGEGKGMPIELPGVGARPCRGITVGCGPYVQAILCKPPWLSRPHDVEALSNPAPLRPKRCKRDR